MSIRVCVTTEDIAAGVRHDARGCPAALAAARLVPAARRVCVVPIRPDGWSVRVYGPGRRFREAVLPAAACGWLAAYTAGGDVGPVEFDLVLSEG